MDLELTDRVALVVGASRGIGLAIARGLAAEGCRVALVARTQRPLEAAAEQLQAQGVRVKAWTADVTDPSQAESVVPAVAREFGGLDVLVHNAGGASGGGLFETSDDQWRQAWELNVLAGVRVVRLAVPWLERSGQGVALFVASIWGRESGGRPVYNAAKAGEIAAAKQLARELAPRGIRVNCVAPGSIWFAGGSWDRRQQADPEGTAAFVRQEIPFGRFGRPEEVADVVTFLASPRARWVTGACVTVDGGQSRSNT